MAENSSKESCSAAAVAIRSTPHQKHSPSEAEPYPKCAEMVVRLELGSRADFEWLSPKKFADVHFLINVLKTLPESVLGKANAPLGKERGIVM